MAGWKKHFIISGCSKFLMPGIGEFDASKENLSEDLLLKAYQRKCPFVGLTPEGIKKYDPEKAPIEVKKIASSEKKEKLEKKESKTAKNSKKPE